MAVHPDDLLLSRLDLTLQVLVKHVATAQPIPLESWGFIIQPLHAKSPRVRQSALKLIQEMASIRSSVWTDVLLSPKAPPETYAKIALAAAEEPSGLLIRYLFTHRSGKHEDFWSPANKTLLQKLLNHPDKEVRLLGLRLSAFPSITHISSPLARLGQSVRRLFKSR